MTGVLFIFSTIWLGFVIEENFALSKGDLLVRFASAVVLGFFWGTWFVFLLALVFGFSSSTIFLTTCLVLTANVWAIRSRTHFLIKFSSIPAIDRRFWSISVGPVALITCFFIFMIRMSDNGDLMFRGNSRDLAFHMATASAFVQQGTFPPLNPQFASAKLSYHFMADFTAAILHKGGLSLYSSFKWLMVSLAFALGTLTCHFLYRVLKDRCATAFAFTLFFFGHIGVINLLFSLAGYPSGTVPVSINSWNSVSDHLTYPYYNFLNVLIDYFQPQLPFLFGFPLAMLVFVFAYNRFTEREPLNKGVLFLLAIVSFLPLFHIHTFLIVSPVVGLLLLIERPKYCPTETWSAGVISRLIQKTLDRRELIMVSTVSSSPADAVKPSSYETRSFDVAIKTLSIFLASIPIGLQLAYILSQEKTVGFSGFDVAKQLGSLPEIPGGFGLKRFWFWMRSAGVPLMLGFVGVIISLRIRMAINRGWREEIGLLAVLLVTGFYFIVINVFRLTPNWGDSNKLFLYLDLVLCIYSGRFLSFCWEKSMFLRTISIGLLSLGSIVPTCIEWITRYNRAPEMLFSASDQLVAGWIKINTANDAVFLTANSTVHLVPALAGRRVVNGAYTRETGYADSAMEELVAQAFRSANPFLIKTVQVDYILVGPEEEGLYHINRTVMERRFRKVYDQSSCGVRYSIYEVKEIDIHAVLNEESQSKLRPWVWLSELDPRSVTQSYGTLKFDRSFDLKSLSLGDKKYDNGLGAHAHSEILFDLNGEYSLFESEVGVDDSQKGGVGTVIFEVWVDERKVYESDVLRAGQDPQKVKVDVFGAKLLKLVAKDADDGNHCDHADWAEARLFRNK